MNIKTTIPDMVLRDFQVTNPMIDILAEFADLRSKIGKVEFYQLIADKLGALVGEVWTWRYVQGVERGSIRPSGKMSEAIRRMGEVIDGRTANLTGLVPISVLAREGVRPGSVVLGSSRVCANPGCGVMFVPDHPRRRYCSPECRRK